MFVCSRAQVLTFPSSQLSTRGKQTGCFDAPWAQRLSHVRHLQYLVTSNRLSQRCAQTTAATSPGHCMQCCFNTFDRVRLQRWLSNSLELSIQHIIKYYWICFFFSFLFLKYSLPLLMGPFGGGGRSQPISVLEYQYRPRLLVHPWLGIFIYSLGVKALTDLV